VLSALVVADLTATFALDFDAQKKPRARDLGIPFEGMPGPLNAITDVAGVEVGLTTIISGDGPLQQGKGPVRTGVTAILPRGKASNDPVFASWFSINGNGEMTGTTWIDEGGFLEGPVFITNTHSVGTVRDAAIKWAVANKKMRQPWALPVVAETYDGGLNDINGFHVKDEHVFRALDTASTGPVAEGNTGGGTAMSCYGFKCGTGTSSRRLAANAGGYTVGVLVQANHGRRERLQVDGVPVGREISREEVAGPDMAAPGAGSIIGVVATDAPLLPQQCRRLAQRAALGVARGGGGGENDSGDIFLAFATGNRSLRGEDDAGAPLTFPMEMLNDDHVSELFWAAIEATEEAILNSMVAAETMTGRDGITFHALPHDRLVEVMRRYGRLG
jgi:L-aminopeptidase/D-esterase-like protein